MDRRLITAQVALGVLLAVAAVALGPWWIRVDTVLEAGISMELPESLPGWVGQTIEPSQVELDYLPEDTGFAKKVYADADGQVIWLSIVMAGRERASIHRPEVCLPGQGFNITRRDLITIPGATTPDGSPLQARRIWLRRDVERDGETLRLGYYYVYWFVGKERTTPSHFQRVILNAVDRAFHGISHRWAYVSYLTPVYGGWEEDAERLTRFIALSYPELDLADGSRVEPNPDAAAVAAGADGP